MMAVCSEMFITNIPLLKHASGTKVKIPVVILKATVAHLFQNLNISERTFNKSVIANLSAKTISHPEGLCD